MGLFRRAVATCCLLLLAAGCTARTPAPPGPLVLSWREIALPAAPAGERIELRAAAVCDGHWYLTGAYAAEPRSGEGRAASSAAAQPAPAGADDATRPAAWTSTDGQAWRALPVAASSAYGPQHELYAAACHDGRLVALGQKPGGAHGNPRVSSYHLVPGPDGAQTLTEVPASLTLYGGGDGINVGRLRAGGTGFLATGNRRLGAAVWLSSDGAAPFDLVEGAAVLSTGDGAVTWAMDAAYVDGSWTVVGATAPSAINRDAASWRSVDGRTWVRVPAQVVADDYDELSAVTPADGGAVAVGTDGDTFQAWRLDSDGWHLAGRFGDTGVTAAGAVPAIAAVAATGGMVLAAVVGPDPYGLWSSVDDGGTWRPVALPPAATGARFVSVTGTGGGFLLTVDDGTGAHAYLATPEGP